MVLSKYCLFVLAFAAHPGLAQQNAKCATLTYDARLLDNSDLPVQEHAGPNASDNWLAMSIQYAPVKELTTELMTLNRIHLKTRGEAHITVITPPEYQALKNLMSMQEIGSIARALKIQESAFIPLCIGKGLAHLGGKLEQTFYIVVDVPNLKKIRQKISASFVQRGGSLHAFQAERFFPHITLGFTARDLFDSDGVIKDDKTCQYNLSPF